MNILRFCLTFSFGLSVMGLMAYAQDEAKVSDTNNKTHLMPNIEEPLQTMKQSLSSLRIYRNEVELVDSSITVPYGAANPIGWMLSQHWALRDWYEKELSTGEKLRKGSMVAMRCSEFETLSEFWKQGYCVNLFRRASLATQLAYNCKLSPWEEVNEAYFLIRNELKGLNSEDKRSFLVIVTNNFTN